MSFVNSQITATTNIDQVKPEVLQRYVELFCQDVVRVTNDIIKIINGGLDLRANFSETTKIVNVNFTAADSEVAISHGLGKTPRGYWVTSFGTLTGAASVYNGTSGWTPDTIYLKCTQVVSADVMFF